MTKHLRTLIVLLLINLIAHANTPEKIEKTDANIIGHVVCNGEHIPFATVMIKGTTLGTMTDETGHFQMVNLKPGEVTVQVSMIGYRATEQKVTLVNNETTELKVSLEEDVLNLDEVVISADRNAQKRTEAAVIVSSISPKLFSSTQSVTLGDGLNFTPGLRLENNCQNCGFSQVRMNGMEGPYSQILINSRPIFSGLAGVYGLELLPTNMIERVEVVRGGGSALFGGNAIAGTINIILKDPVRNTYQGGANYSLIGVGADGSGGPASDYSVNFNGSVISDDRQTGLSIYGFTRERQMYDANDDSFSEVAPLENLTFGARAFHRFGMRDKLAIDFFAIHEDRDGGNMQDYPIHERDIAEVVTHDMKVAALTYERFFRKYDMFTAYASSQFLDRDSYYGANQSLSDYGFSQGKTLNIGATYKALFSDDASLVFGVENTSDFLVDQKLGYSDYENLDSTGNATQVPNTTVADQSSITTGAFAQYELKIDRFKVSAGLRYDHYNIIDHTDDTNEKSGDVLSPRLSLMYNIRKNLQIRTSYSQGYRAPQIFDEDLHIETSGSRQVLHNNSADLTQETSHSFMLSMDFNKMIGSVYTGLLIEGFHTRLNDAFVSDIGAPDADGTVLYTRVNAEGTAVVQGVNLELKLKPMRDLSFTSGLTLQTSEYEEVQDEQFNEKSFYRTPNTYAFFAFDWDFYDNFCFTTSGTYTGTMLVPYYGTENPDGELRESDDFFDLGAKMSYTLEMSTASVEFSAGIKNIFNQYQSDFDIGIDRDPAYIYGPSLPRTIYFGVKFGNFL